MIEEFAAFIPESLKSKSGSVFYSGRNAFNSQSDVYILGLNPGGSADEQANETIAWHTEQVLFHKPADWSCRSRRRRMSFRSTKMKDGWEKLPEHMGYSPGFCIYFAS